MCDSHPVPKVFISLRLLLFRYESHIQNQLFPSFSFSFTLKRKTYHVHSETKDTSYTPTIPFLCLSALRNRRHIQLPPTFHFFFFSFYSVRKDISNILTIHLLVNYYISETKDTSYGRYTPSRLQ